MSTTGKPLRFILILEGTWNLSASEDEPKGCTIQATFAHDATGSFEEEQTTFLVPLPIRHMDNPVRWGQTQLTEAVRLYLVREPGDKDDGDQEAHDKEAHDEAGPDDGEAF